ncbi:hypothetical protein BDF21DRAFT_498613 [Thamnidium elegans]|uniref:NudC domain-containing protein 1 n=1 Tax=Thamnidium elegans TaxID=101142 RepID=A0A8H7SUM9_9FUNG|nr:hypothetical protein INT48_004159 [Thamnidium elegans]KAI8049349.1 hypothetical protein BDF21DRAFT_498613 [Thamnidium elegans]
MNTRLIPDLTKINAKFEGYKLSPFGDSVYRTSLSEGNIFVQDKTTDHRLGFRDLQARIRHSHLIYGFPLDDNRGTCFCIDKQFNLHMIVFNKSTKQTNFFFITQLIQPLPVPSFTEPADTVPIEPQIPTAIAISPELLVVSNGVGDIELIGIEEKYGVMLGTSLSSVCYLGTGTEGISPVPCMLLTARKIKEKIVLVACSRATSKKTEFNVATLQMNVPTTETERLEDGSFVLMLHTLHIQKGAEVPVYCSITPSGERCIFGSESRYVKETFSEDQEQEEIKSPMEVADPYKWTQDGADITVAFQLPDTVTKSTINCKFITDHLSLFVRVGNETIVSYPYRKLWSTVRPDECIWTFESGLLTLFLTKVDQHTRWPQLFNHDDGVLENLSQDSLMDIKNKLEKLTANDDDSNNKPKDGTMALSSEFSKPVQHPAATDMDEEIDQGGQPIIFSVYDTNGTVVDEFSSGTFSWICQSFTNTPHLPSVCLQMDVDGLVFSFTELQDLSIKVDHQISLDAFAFVQASKRDARFVHHDPNFHFTSIIESSRNAYIYLHHNDKRILETQTLIDLTQGHDVDVIGAQLVLPNVLMILTESQIVIIELTEIN